jgi:hypothetical protein
MLKFDHVGRRLHRGAVDGQQHVAGLDAGQRRRRAWRDLDRGDPFGTAAPQHTVFDLVPPRVQRDSGGAQREKHQHHDCRED